ncbi:MAG: signal recognition particle-docking protein FtsY [Spirochaetes bacterium]|nr:signal recognition particle-docking protein FtsY [Spirochaetota bacterium]
MKLNIQIGKRLGGVFSKKAEKKDEIIPEIEEILITSDFGVEFTQQIISELEKRVGAYEREEVLAVLREILKERISLASRAPQPAQDSRMTVHLVFGVNGTGKTTSIGKLAFRLKKEKRRVLIAAADTFRDAAIEQLSEWARRADVPVIRQGQGADPGAVVYDAIDAAYSRKVNDLIVDTAGRLHNKERLMEELKKISKILDKKAPGETQNRLLVLDATTGQNAIEQARQFNEYTGVDGIILTKLDSSAKGGVACTVSGMLGVPILWAGTGEKIEDLVSFNIDEYIDILLS